jgi:hypothetical protein
MLSGAKDVCVFPCTIRPGFDLRFFASLRMTLHDQRGLARSLQEVINAIVGRLCQRRFGATGVSQNGAAWEASDMDGQFGRASERERASQTPYNFFARAINVDLSSCNERSRPIL